MDQTQRSPFVITRPAQIEALAHPTRQDIVDRLVAAGPLPVAALARSIGRRPDRLYYHLGRLEEVGLVVRTGEAGGDAHFDVPGRPVQMSYGPESPEGVAAVVKAVGSMLRAAHGDFASALESASCATRGPGRTVRASRVSAWLSAEDLAELNHRVEELLDQFRVRVTEPPSGSTLVELVVLTAPLPSPAGAPFET